MHKKDISELVLQPEKSSGGLQVLVKGMKQHEEIEVKTCIDDAPCVAIHESKIW